MVFCFTVIFGFSVWNRLTSSSMNGPSPPVKPFQYASVTAGPVYFPVNLLPLSVPLTVDIKVCDDWEGMTPLTREDEIAAEAGELPLEAPLAPIAG